MAPDNHAAVSRRSTLAAGLLAPAMAADAIAGPLPGGALRQLAERCRRQAQLFNTGDMAGWLALADPADGFTLMQPFGGPVSHGFDRAPAHLAALAAQFRDGDARIELEHAVAEADLAVLAYIERQSIRVAGLPRQDWSLRVTQVFGRRGGRWQLLHRHADPLVRPIPVATAAALAAGTGLQPVAAGEG